MPEIQPYTTITATPVKTEDNLVKVSIETRYPVPEGSTEYVSSSQHPDQFLTKETYEKFQAIAKAVTQEVLSSGNVLPDNPDRNGYNIAAAALTALVSRDSEIELVKQGTDGFKALVAAAKIHQKLSPDDMAEKMQEALQLQYTIRPIVVESTPPQFATVDKVELVGFIPAEAALQASLTPLAEQLIGSVTAAHLAIENITKTLPPGQNLWQALPPSVQPLVQSVEEAHNAIQNAVVMAANEAKAQAQPQPAATPAPAAVNSALQLLNVPQPVLSHVAQVAPCGCGPQMAV